MWSTTASLPLLLTFIVLLLYTDEYSKVNSYQNVVTGSMYSNKNSLRSHPKLFRPLLIRVADMQLRDTHSKNEPEPVKRTGNFTRQQPLEPGQKLWVKKSTHQQSNYVKFQPPGQSTMDTNHRPHQPQQRKPSTDPRMVNIIGCIVEYRAKTGSKQLALVTSTLGKYTLQVVNDKKMTFSIHVSKVAYRIEGDYSVGDLLTLTELQMEFKPTAIEKLWEKQSRLKQLQRGLELNISTIAQEFFRTNDPLRQFVAAKMMLSHHGKMYFYPVFHNASLNADAAAIDDTRPSQQQKASEQQQRQRKSLDATDDYKQLIFMPYVSQVVQENLRDRAALREFRQRYQKVVTRTGGSLGGYDDGSSTSITSSVRSTSNSDDEIGDGFDSSRTVYDYSFLSEMPERVERVLETYQTGLQHIVLSSHPWVKSGLLEKNPFNDEEKMEKASELLGFLGLSPNAKNARRVLEVTGVWSPHENVEKHLMQIRTQFPQKVLDEAQVLLDNADFLVDMDERLRRDLRHLGTYSVDREGTTEVDDALSIERLEDGRDKLWIHIADVGRWIRPGSELSIEAERRMSSIYMPDEKICMFPDILTTDLLSLSARPETFALSCGVTLDSNGDVTSYEVCPSRISLDRQLSYAELDYILDTYGEFTAQEDLPSGMQEIIEPLLETTDGSAEEKPYTQFGSNLRIKRNNIRPRDAAAAYEKYDPLIVRDLLDLRQYAVLRHKQRATRGALDDLVRHRMELHLSVKSNARNPFAKVSVNGFVSWSNSSSVQTVSEYMILMSQTIGNFCVSIEAPVWYKVQSTNPPLAASDTQLRPGETRFLRSARIMQHMEPARDSATPGFHCTSASDAYVQCTSPIRRYHDLYNHYRLKAAMHRASLSEEWADRAEEEAGIKLLDSMATAEQRLKTLSDIRMVSRQREQYWLNTFISDLISTESPPVFDAIILQKYDHNAELIKREERLEYLSKQYNARKRTSAATPIAPVDERFEVYQAIILQLGSYTPYKIYYPKSTVAAEASSSSTKLLPGTKLQCHLYQLRNTNSYALLPADLTDPADFPRDIVEDIIRSLELQKLIAAGNKPSPPLPPSASASTTAATAGKSQRTTPSSSLTIDSPSNRRSTFSSATTTTAESAVKAVGAKEWSAQDAAGRRDRKWRQSSARIFGNDNSERSSRSRDAVKQGKNGPNGTNNRSTEEESFDDDETTSEFDSLIS